MFSYVFYSESWWIYMMEKFLEIPHVPWIWSFPSNFISKTSELSLFILPISCFCDFLVSCQILPLVALFCFWSCTILYKWNHGVSWQMFREGGCHPYQYVQEWMQNNVTYHPGNTGPDSLLIFIFLRTKVARQHLWQHGPFSTHKSCFSIQKIMPWH